MEDTNDPDPEARPPGISMKWKWPGYMNPLNTENNSENSTTIILGGTKIIVASKTGRDNQRVIPQIDRNKRETMDNSSLSSNAKPPVVIQTSPQNGNRRQAHHNAVDISNSISSEKRLRCIVPITVMDPINEKNTFLSSLLGERSQHLFIRFFRKHQFLHIIDPILTYFALTCVGGAMSSKDTDEIEFKYVMCIITLLGMYPVLKAITQFNVDIFFRLMRQFETWFLLTETIIFFILMIIMQEEYTLFTCIPIIYVTASIIIVILFDALPAKAKKVEMWGFIIFIALTWEVAAMDLLSSYSFTSQANDPHQFELNIMQSFATNRLLTLTAYCSRNLFYLFVYPDTFIVLKSNMSFAKRRLVSLRAVSRSVCVTERVLRSRIEYGQKIAGEPEIDFKTTSLRSLTMKSDRVVSAKETSFCSSNWGDDYEDDLELSKKSYSMRENRPIEPQQKANPTTPAVSENIPRKMANVSQKLSDDTDHSKAITTSGTYTNADEDEETSSNASIELSSYSQSSLDREVTQFNNGNYAEGGDYVEGPNNGVQKQLVNTVKVQSFKKLSNAKKDFDGTLKPDEKRIPSDADDVITSIDQQPTAPPLKLLMFSPTSTKSQRRLLARTNSSGEVTPVSPTSATTRGVAASQTLEMTLNRDSGGSAGNLLSSRQLSSGKVFLGNTTSRNSGPAQSRSVVDVPSGTASPNNHRSKDVYLRLMMPTYQPKTFSYDNTILRDYAGDDIQDFFWFKLYRHTLYSRFQVLMFCLASFLFMISYVVESYWPHGLDAVLSTSVTTGIISCIMQIGSFTQLNTLILFELWKCFDVWFLFTSTLSFFVVFLLSAFTLGDWRRYLSVIAVLIGFVLSILQDASYMGRKSSHSTWLLSTSTIILTLIFLGYSIWEAARASFKNGNNIESLDFSILGDLRVMPFLLNRLYTMAVFLIKNLVSNSYQTEMFVILKSRISYRKSKASNIVKLANRT